MSSDEYEKAYREAREALFLRGKKIGQQRYGQDGIRYCAVDGSWLRDRDVFKEAWSEAIAKEIFHDMAESVSQNANGCLECDRLWREYELATGRYLEIFTIQRIAADKQDSMALAIAGSQLDHAAQVRQAVRKFLRNHSAAHIIVKQQIEVRKITQMQKGVEQCKAPTWIISTDLPHTSPVHHEFTD